MVLSEFHENKFYGSNLEKNANVSLLKGWIIGLISLYQTLEKNGFVRTLQKQMLRLEFEGKKR